MAEQISYIIEIKNRFERNLNNFNRQIKKSNKTLNSLKSNLNSISKKMSKLGKDFFLKVTAPIAGGLGLSLRAWDKQQKAIAQVGIGIESTGGIAGRTLDQLRNQASKLQSETLFGDEKILSEVTAQILTFTNITGKNFDKTQQAVLDVATRLAAARGGVVDLTSTSIMLGKALNDPVANLGALSRSGIQFSEAQKKIIKSLVQTGNISKAQSLILKELQTQYGGAAKAAASVGLGPLQQAMNLLGDTFEEVGEAFGEMIMPYIPSIKEALLSSIEWIKNNKQLVQSIIKISLAFAFVGPLIVSLAILIKSISIIVSLLAALKFVIIGVAAIFSSIPIAIGAVVLSVTALFIFLEKKFQIFSKAFEKIKGSRLVSFLNRSKGGGFNINEVSEIKQVSKTPSNKSQSVDISGNIVVGATKDTEVKRINFNRGLGINVKQSMAGVGAF